MLLKNTRRGFITGLASLIVAPAIVKVESIMPISASKIWIPEPGEYIIDIESFGLGYVYPYESLALRYNIKNNALLTHILKADLTQ